MVTTLLALIAFLKCGPKFLADVLQLAIGFGAIGARHNSQTAFTMSVVRHGLRYVLDLTSLLPVLIQVWHDLTSLPA